MPSIPKLVPHCCDWKASVPDGIGMGLIPSGLRFGMKIKLAQAVPEAPLAPIAVVGEAPTWNGSGEVVDDSFHWMAQ